MDYEAGITRRGSVIIKFHGFRGERTLEKKYQYFISGLDCESGLSRACCV